MQLGQELIGAAGAGAHRRGWGELLGVAGAGAHRCSWGRSS